MMQSRLPLHSNRMTYHYAEIINHQRSFIEGFQDLANFFLKTGNFNGLSWPVQIIFLYQVDVVLVKGTQSSFGGVVASHRCH